MFSRALGLYEVNFGPTHPHVALVLNHLAAVLQRLNRGQDAEPLQRRALAIDQNLYGLVHPQVGIDLNNLAMLLLSLGRSNEAEPVQVQALEVMTRVFGRHHANVRSCKQTLDLIRKRHNG